MRYLTDETGGNIHDNGTIKITSNSILNVRRHPKNLVDCQSDNYSHSSNGRCPYICFDFKDRRVQLSDYSIKSFSSGQSGGLLRSWVLEVSNDGGSWEEVDCHTEDPTPDGPSITANYKLANASSGFYRYIKLRSTGCSWYNYPSDNYCIYFYFIEFFGKLDESQCKWYTNKQLVWNGVWILLIFHFKCICY